MADETTPTNDELRRMIDEHGRTVAFVREELAALRESNAATQARIEEALAKNETVREELNKTILQARKTLAAHERAVRDLGKPKAKPLGRDLRRNPTKRH